MLVEGNNDDNWPKQCEMHRLGLHVSFFLLSLSFLDTTDALKVRMVQWGGQQQQQRAQTMRDASFGP